MKIQTVETDECQTDDEERFDVDVTPCFSQLPDLINMKNRCYRQEARRVSAAARPLLRLSDSTT